MTEEITTVIFKEAVNYSNKGFSFDSFTLIRNKKLYFAIKRIADIFISLLVIILILSWLIPILAILIILDSKGPVFFAQRRVGRFGKSFYCLKFRTMEMNIEADFKQAEDYDSRITKLGFYLRKTNLDELPQFINVLLGDMSVVGPRPHMQKDCVDFNNIIQEYKLRSLVKPGITGVAQVKGYRGPTNTLDSIINRYKWDIYYVKNANSNLDLKIIIKTVIQTVVQFFKIILKKRKSLFIKRRKKELQLGEKKFAA
ncbi:MAG: sugar transferase [Sphingobacteriales bacterium]